MANNSTWRRFPLEWLWWRVSNLARATPVLPLPRTCERVIAADWKKLALQEFASWPQECDFWQRAQGSNELLMMKLQNVKQ
jgi:hypothetical protein